MKVRIPTVVRRGPAKPMSAGLLLWPMLCALLCASSGPAHAAPQATTASDASPASSDAALRPTPTHCPALRLPAEVSGTVFFIVDGDRLTLRVAPDCYRRVALGGIEPPEVAAQAPTTPPTTPPSTLRPDDDTAARSYPGPSIGALLAQALGRRATGFCYGLGSDEATADRALTSSATLPVTAGAPAARTPLYLCRLFVDGVDLSGWMIDHGWAAASRTTQITSIDPTAHQREANARQARRGVWGAHVPAAAP